MLLLVTYELVRKVKKLMELDYQLIKDIPMLDKFVKREVKEAAEKAAEKLMRWRESLLRLVKNRFPALLIRARTKASHTQSPDVLQEVLDNLMLANSLEEAQQIVQNWPVSPTKESADDQQELIDSE